MKIGIDISQVIYGTGVSVYTRNLVENLLRIDHENEYILFGGSLRRLKELKNITRNFQASVYCRNKGKLYPIPPSFADILWNKLHLLPIELLIGKIDVFHSSDWAQPPTKAFKVTTVHDLIPLIFPKQSHPKLVRTHKQRLTHVIKKVDRIITPSITTKEDLIKFGAKEKIIRVIPEAPGKIYKPAMKTQIEKLKKAYRIPEKYLLTIGLSPRKNIQRIIKAFEKMRAGKNLRLAVIGHPYIKIDIPRGVHMLGHIPEHEMPVILSGAEALVYPSLYEGFGLPILEAFACKTPVITSNLGSMREVAGNAAALVNPHKVDSIAEGIKKALKYREKLVKKGLDRVGEFSWKKTAEKTLKVYEEV